MSEQSGKRIQKKEAKEKRPSRLSRGQKWLLVLAAVLAAALAVTVTLKTLFVKPELPNKGEDTQGGDTQGQRTSLTMAMACSPESAVSARVRIITRC